MIVKVQGGGGGTYANTGSCENVVNYLQHEDFERLQEGKNVEMLFDQNSNNVKPQEAREKIDNNRKGLKAKEAKFYVITVAPSSRELRAMGKTDEERSEALRDYVRNQVMKSYAEGFTGKNLKADDLVYYAKIHHNRDEKTGENMHAHIIVSHKTKGNGKAISPKTNHTGQKNTGVVKGGFNRNEWFSKCEAAFDKQFSYERDRKESFAYLNAVKNGSVKDMKGSLDKLMNEENNTKLKEMKSENTKFPLNKNIDRVSIKETNSGNFLNIRYKDSTGSSHKLNPNEIEGIRTGRYSLEAIANDYAAKHLEQTKEYQRGGGLAR